MCIFLLHNTTLLCAKSIHHFIAFTIHFGPKHFPFWAKTHPILGQNASHFGPKRILFWAKMPSYCAKTFCVLGQIIFHFAAKRVPFCGKTQSILRQNAIHFAAKCILSCRKTPIKPNSSVLSARSNSSTIRLAPPTPTPHGGESLSNHKKINWYDFTSDF